MIHITCDCGAALRVDQKMAGRRGKCPKCGGPILVPETAIEVEVEEVVEVAEIAEPDGLPWGPWLRQCQQKLGNAPRRFADKEVQEYLRVRRGCLLPLLFNDKLNQLLRPKQQLDIFANGVVVWGHIIQANSRLFTPGDDDLPGEFVFSMDTSGRVGPEYLASVAEQLGSLKGSKPTHPDLLPIARYLTDEYIRVFGWAVPKPLSPR
ncbi:MAG: hypothetical protein WBD31_10130, partial [Rubripirellula sp.]